MNNWEIFRARMEGDPAVVARLDEVRDAAREMAEAAARADFSRDGPGPRRRVGRPGRRWRPSSPRRPSNGSSRRRSPRVAGPARRAAPGEGDASSILAPAEKTRAVREALGGCSGGKLLLVAPENRGLEVRAA
jgi:hypothetical protein